MIIYTKHAEEKLTRSDIKKFKIKKKLLENIISRRKRQNKTKYGNYATLAPLDTSHDIRIIYDIIDKDIKVITFHIARKGRYK